MSEGPQAGSRLAGGPSRGVLPGSLVGGLLLLVSLGCSGKAEGVRPDDMSAEQHRAAARREEAVAATQKAEWNPNAVVPNPPSPVQAPVAGEGTYAYALPAYNPTDWHLAEARKHEAHARQHEAAAVSLERFERAECKDFPPATRPSCPLLGPAEDIHDIDGGVVIRFAPSVRVDAIVAHMKCHLAYARAQGYQDAPTCPLYLPGLSIRLGAAPSTVEITVDKKKRQQVEALRHSAHEEIAIEEKRPPG